MKSRGAKRGVATSPGYMARWPIGEALHCRCSLRWVRFPYVSPLDNASSKHYTVGMDICLQCDTEFEPKDKRFAKFCGQSCSAKFNNRGRRRHGSDPSNCLNCGIKNRSARNKYCSIACSSEHKKSKRIADWLDGTWSGSDLSGILSDTIRSYLVEQAGFACTRCGWAEVSEFIAHGKPVLTVDHIDGNWKNNNPKNLTVLCYNCHTLTPNWGSLSKNGMSRERMGRHV